MAEIVYSPSLPATIEVKPIVPAVVQQPETTEGVVNVGVTRVVDVAMPGPRGPKGEKGDPGDGTSMVLSINGMVGDVVLDAPDVHADPEGAAIAAASAAVSTHLSDPDPHPQYLKTVGNTLDGGNF